MVFINTSVQGVRMPRKTSQDSKQKGKKAASTEKVKRINTSAARAATAKAAMSASFIAATTAEHAGFVEVTPGPRDHADELEIIRPVQLEISQPPQVLHACMKVLTTFKTECSL